MRFHVVLVAARHEAKTEELVQCSMIEPAEKEMLYKRRGEEEAGGVVTVYI